MAEKEAEVRSKVVLQMLHERESQQEWEELRKIREKQWVDEVIKKKKKKEEELY